MYVYYALVKKDSSPKIDLSQYGFQPWKTPKRLNDEEIWWSKNLDAEKSAGMPYQILRSKYYEKQEVRFFGEDIVVEEIEIVEHNRVWKLQYTVVAVNKTLPHTKILEEELQKHNQQESLT